MSRSILALAGGAIGAYTIFGVSAGIAHGTNAAWLSGLTLVSLVLAALLVKAGLAKRSGGESMSRRLEAWLLTCLTAVGAISGYVLGGTVLMAVTAFLAVLAGSLAFIARSP